MTVCIAALFRWNYSSLSNPIIGAAGIILTDRMITAGDVEYEPQQTKLAAITSRIALVIAGDYSLHSQAIKATVSRFRTEPSAHPRDVSSFYGRQIQALKLKEAEDVYLAPLGLNSDSFLAQQKDMAPHFVSLLTEQMQNYRGEEVEALIIGSSGDYVQLYGVDTKGVVSCFDDVGFAAIGSGAWHAKSRMMQSGYTNNAGFARAAAICFAAKKASETAPGVGTNTDVQLVFNNSIEPMRRDVAAKLHDLYSQYSQVAIRLADDTVEEFQSYINKPSLQVANEEPKGLPGGDAQTDERISAPAAETARADEGGQKAKEGQE